MKPACAGDVVLADTYASKKYHIVTLRRSKADCERADYQDELEYHAKQSAKWRAAHRAPKAPVIEPRDDGYWQGASYCGGGDTKTTFGNVQSYYWEVRRFRDEDDICKDCRRKWKAAGSPTIAGWTDHAEVGDPPLPYGWHEVPVVGHPYDVAPDGDPELVRDGAGVVQGERRTELRRWQRGPRIVRLVHHYADNHYAARVLTTDKTTETWKYQGSQQYATTQCWVLMARGGY